MAVFTDESLTIYEISTGAVIYNHPSYSIDNYFFSTSTPYKDIYFSKDGEVIYTNTLNRVLSAIEIATGNILWETESDDPFSTGIDTFTVNGSVCVGADGSDVFIIDLLNGSRETIFEANGSIKNIYISDCGNYAVLRAYDIIYIIDLNTGECIMETVVEDNSPYYIDDEEYMPLVLDYEVFTASDAVIVWKRSLIIDADAQEFVNSYLLSVYNLATGEEIGEWRGGKEDYKIYPFDENSVAIISETGFIVYDFRGDTVLYRANAPLISGFMLHEGLTYAASENGGVWVYDNDTPLEGLFIDAPVGLSSLNIVNNVLTAVKDNAVYVFNTAAPPNTDLLEPSIKWVNFIDNGSTMLCIAGANGVFTLKILSDNNSVYEYITDFDTISEAVYDKHSGLLFINDRENIKIFNITHDSITLVDTMSPDKPRIKLVNILRNEKKFTFRSDRWLLSNENMNNFLEDVFVREYSIPVIYGGNEIIVFWRGFDDIGFYNSEDTVSDVFISEDTVAAHAGASLMIFARDNSSFAKHFLFSQYAVNPVYNEFITYDGNEKTFTVRSFFSESAEDLSLNIPGTVNSIFYHPSGGVLFIATDANRLFAYDFTQKTTNEIEAVFNGRPADAFMTYNHLAIEERLDELRGTSVFNTHTTLLNPNSYKPVARIEAEFMDQCPNNLLISNGQNIVNIPLYNTQSLIDTADDALKLWDIPEDITRLYLHQNSRFR